MVGFAGLLFRINCIVSELAEHPILSVLITKSLTLSLKVFDTELVRSALDPKYHFIESLLLALVIDNFKESPGQKERLVVEKIGLANPEQFT